MEWSATEIDAASDQGEKSSLGRVLWPDWRAETARTMRQAMQSIGRMDRLFLVRAPDAPGLCFFGASHVSDGPGGARRARSFSGAGTGPTRAFLRLSGEVAEAEAFGPSPSPLGWVMGPEVDLHRQAPDARDVCARLTPDKAQPHDAADRQTQGRSGLAAHERMDKAFAAAALELIERDATALWWIGGAPLRRLRFKGDAQGTIDAYAARLRAGSTDRRRQFFDLTTDLEIPTVLCLTQDVHGARSAWGAACRPDLTEAAISALREACQMECGRRLIELKEQQGGPEALSHTDRAHLETSEALDAGSHGLLSVAGDTWATAPTAEAAPDAVMARLLRTIRSSGLDWRARAAFHADSGLYVVESAAPALQSMRPDMKTDRLHRTVSATGGRSQEALNLELV